MSFETFIFLIIAIAVGVGLGTGKLSVDQLFLYLWRTFMGMMKTVLWLLLLLIILSVSYMLMSFLSSIITLSDLGKQIIIWCGVLTITGYSFWLIINIKIHGFKKGFNEAFKDSSPSPQPKAKLQIDWDKLTIEQKKFVKRTKKNYWLLYTVFFLLLGIPLLLMGVLPSLNKEMVIYDLSSFRVIDVLGIFWVIILLSLGIFILVFMWKTGRRIKNLPKKTISNKK